MKYEFKIGDIVKVVHWGSGFNASLIKEQYKIINTGIYGNGSNRQAGYQVEDLSGKLHINDGYDNFVGEKSFELVNSSEINYKYEIY